MRGLFLLGCGLLLLESACGSTSRSSGAPAGAGRGGAGDERGPAAMTSSGGDSSDSSDEAVGGASTTGAGGGESVPLGAGSGGEAGAPVEVQPDCGCSSTSIAWWRIGGRRVSQHASSVVPCGSFQHVISDSDDVTISSCKSQLVGGCDASLGVYELNAAILHPDVQAALAVAPVLYGKDMRDSDGQIEHVEIDDQVIEIGAECPDPECVIPEGVAALGILLGSIREHELGSGCNLEP